MPRDFQNDEVRSLRDFSLRSNEVKPKPDVLSVAGLAAWLRTQDGATEYQAGDGSHCVLVQYLNAKGWRVETVGLINIYHRKGWFRRPQRTPVPHDLASVAYMGLYPDRQTYAAALARCEFFLAREASQADRREA
jgi:hypothetical protein